MATQAVDRGSPACLTCGAASPPDARFCSVCGAPFGSVPAAAPEPDRCQITRWRGYVRSTFYATTPDGTMFESKPFAWRHAAPPPPDHEGARSCYEALVERLLAGGWERESQGVIWYETGFVRGAPGMVVSEEPAAQPAPEPEPDEKNGRATARWARSLLAVKRVLAMAALVCVILAATFVVVGAAHPGAKHVATPPPASVPAATHRASVARAAPVSRPKLADVRIEAQRNGSWLEVRRGSSSGAVLYSSVLLPGTQLHFRGPRLWARMGAAGNLSITANGRPVSLRGTFDKVFVPASQT
ncbi:MAG TPA: RodZ domain-containing protein [Gaiellaceae bacterium]|nr:RodZ domain-containing protein [Gaiellaceae bacterium]